MSPATIRIALTGGIGSGKSEVARMLAERGAVIVDADDTARRLVEPGQPALAEIVDAFGSSVINDDGTLNRAALAKIVFNDPEQLQGLNSIMHPRIAAATRTSLQAAPAGSVVVYDMPLLVELGLTQGWDLIVVVDTPDEVRVQRLTAFRGLRETDVRARMAAQASREQRNAAADVIIDNSRDLDSLVDQVAALWGRLRESREPPTGTTSSHGVRPAPGA